MRRFLNGLNKNIALCISRVAYLTYQSMRHVALKVERQKTLCGLRRLPFLVVSSGLPLVKVLLRKTVIVRDLQVTKVSEEVAIVQRLAPYRRGGYAHASSQQFSSIGGGHDQRPYFDKGFQATYSACGKYYVGLCQRVIACYHCG